MKKINSMILITGVLCLIHHLYTGLREKPFNARNFTWVNNLEDATFEKLDRVFFFPEWEEHCPLSMLQAFAREVSNHTPLFLYYGDRCHAPPFFSLRNH